VLLAASCACTSHVCCHLQREHVDLLNGYQPAPSPTAAAAKPGSKGLASSPAAALGANPIAALQQMQHKLDALRVRKQRITGELQRMLR
jgi:hypothetical protein